MERAIEVKAIVVQEQRHNVRERIQKSLVSGTEVHSVGYPNLMPFAHSGTCLH